jgi:hypothetical protein
LNPGTDPSSGDSAEPQRIDNPDDPLILQQLNGELAAATSAMGITLDIDTLGTPLLFPGDAVEIDGLGDRLKATNWAVFKVTHTYNSSGLSTSFTAISNTANILASSEAAQGQGGSQEAQLDSTVLITPTPGAGGNTPASGSNK